LLFHECCILTYIRQIIDAHPIAIVAIVAIQLEGAHFSFTDDWACQMNLLHDTFPTSLCTLLIHQTTQNGVHKTIGFSSSGVRVLDFLYYKKTFGALF